MPRYFFHFHGSDASDSEGQDFPDDAAARREAVTVARELARNNKSLSGDERLVVTNADGKVIHEEPLRRKSPLD